MFKGLFYTLKKHSSIFTSKENGKGKLFFPSSSLFYFIFLSCVTKLATSQSPLVTNFCHQIQDPAFCFKIIASDPRFQTAKTIHDLETLTIDLGTKFVKGVTNKCTILLEREKDVKIRAALGSCGGAYGIIRFRFDSMREAYQIGRPLSVFGADATVAVLKCNHDFDEQKLISPLAQDNHNLLNFIQMIVGNAAETF